MYNFLVQISIAVMKTLEKKSAAQEAIEKQLEAIKNQAFLIWGDDWEARLCNAYEQKNGYKHRSKNSKVRAWFNGEYLPSLASFNELLVAVDCQMKIVSNPREIL